MAATLNHKTIDFEELTNHWSSGDNVYGSGAQLDNTTPSQIFVELLLNNNNLLGQYAKV